MSMRCPCPAPPLVVLMRHVAVLLMLAAGAAFVGAKPAAAATEHFMFILDASGSMAAKMEGQTKMVIAKKVMVDLVDNLPADLNVGLVAYGHRQKKECTDVEELAQLGVPMKKALLERINGLQPLGMTPITYAIQKVAESVQSVEGETTIVLVSDGKETCEGDPCALVRELKASGSRFVMHVIGFDVTDKEKEQLACIAEAGGGNYFTTKNAQDLRLATGKIVAKTESSAAKLVVRAQRNGTPFSAFCRVFRPAEGDEEKQLITDGWTDKAAATFKLSPGRYDLEVENHEDAGNPKVSFTGIVIEPGKPVEKVADFSGGTLMVRAQRNGTLFSAFCRIYKPAAGDEEKQLITDGWTEQNGATFKLQPGVYELEVENNEDAGQAKVSFAGVAIEPGKPVEKMADFSGGTLVVRAQRNAKPFSAFCRIYKPAAGDEEKQLITDGWTEQNGATFKLQPGVYDLEVENNEDAGQAKVSFAGVVIEPGKPVEKIADFSGGTLVVKAQRNAQPFSAFCRIFKPAAGDQEKQLVVDGWTDQNGGTFKLQPGVYDLEVENNEDAGQPVVKFAAISVEAAKRSEQTADFFGGTLKVKALKNGKSISVFCRVFQPSAGDEQKQQVTDGWAEQEGGTFKLVPGTYEVVVEHQESGANKEFKGVTVSAGQLQTLEAQF